MTIRSIALFVHVLGMLMLFVGLAAEWLSLETLRRSNGETSPLAVSVLRALPRSAGISGGLLLLSGIYMAARVAVWDFAWVRLSFVALIAIAILGRVALRPVVRDIQQSPGDRSQSLRLRQHASGAFLQASLRVRVAIALAIVYLMIDKPEALASVAVVGVALAIGAVLSLQRRSQSIFVRS